MPMEESCDPDALLARTNPLLCDYITSGGVPFNADIAGQLSSDQRRAFMTYTLYELDRFAYNQPGTKWPVLMVLWLVLSVFGMIPLLFAINPVVKPGAQPWPMPTAILGISGLVNGILIVIWGRWMHRRRFRPGLRKFRESAARIGALKNEVDECLAEGRLRGWPLAKAA